MTVTYWQLLHEAGLGQEARKMFFLSTLQRLAHVSKDIYGAHPLPGPSHGLHKARFFKHGAKLAV